MRINTNLLAIHAYTSYKKSGSQLESAVRKLTSGYAINSAADDPAGLCISEKMRAQIRGLQVAKSNARDAVSLLTTADGALSNINAILQRMRELAVRSSTGTLDDKTDREALQAEFSQLQDEIDDIASTASFNMRNLLDGSLASLKTGSADSADNFDTPDALLSAFVSQGQNGKAGGLVIQVGANTGEEKVIHINQMNLSKLGLSSSGVGTRDAAASAIGSIDSAIKEVSSQRSRLGTMISGFEDTANMDIGTLAAAESRIRDTDIAKEVTNFANAAVLQQTALALMAQANALPKSVLALLGA